MIENIVSGIAAVLTTTSFIPQAIKVIRTKETQAISLLMYIMLSVGVFFWFIFGLIINNYPTILANAITFMLSVSILAIKIKNSQKKM